MTIKASVWEKNMADRMAAEIHIGGKVRRSVAEDLCEIIRDAHASLEWGEAAFWPDEPEELLRACATDDHPRVLKLFDDEARWGEFETLESFLQEQDIAYCRWTEGKYEYDGEIVMFRPGAELLCWRTDHDRHEVVAASTMQPIETRLTSVLDAMKQGEKRAVEALSEIEAIRDALRAELPPDVPPLEPLEIVED